MKVEAKIQKWGNSLALRLTGPVKQIPHFEADMLVLIKVSETGIRVEPIKEPVMKEKFTEEELLKGLTARTAHADEIASINEDEMEY